MIESKHINLHSTVQRNPDMLFTGFDDEMVMLSIDDGKYYGINPVGVRVWELIEQRNRIDSIVAAVCDEFDVSVGQCQQDVLAFVHQLLQKNMASLC